MRSSGAGWPAPQLQRLPTPDVALELRLPPEWEERERGCRCVFIDGEDGMGRRSDSSRGLGFSSMVTAEQKTVGAAKYGAGGCSLPSCLLLPFRGWAREGQRVQVTVAAAFRKERGCQRPAATAGVPWSGCTPAQGVGTSPEGKQAPVGPGEGVRGGGSFCLIPGLLVSLVGTQNPGWWQVLLSYSFDYITSTGVGRTLSVSSFFL